MGRLLKNILVGAGWSLDIYPAPAEPEDQDQRFDLAWENTVGKAWQEVGDHLAGAMWTYADKLPPHERQRIERSLEKRRDAFSISCTGEPVRTDRVFGSSCSTAGGGRSGVTA